LKWRESVGRPLGFDTLRATKPIVSVGAEHPLEDETLMADYFRRFNTGTGYVRKHGGANAP
jgi:hypothetical protein